jgi:hypothetical protein
MAWHLHKRIMNSGHLGLRFGLGQRAFIASRITLAFVWDTQHCSHKGRQRPMYGYHKSWQWSWTWSESQGLLELLDMTYVMTDTDDTIQHMNDTIYILYYILFLIIIALLWHGREHSLWSSLFHSSSSSSRTSLDDFCPFLYHSSWLSYGLYML